MSGLANESKFEDGVSRYKLKYGFEHHDHLICTSCGIFIEVVDSGIEELRGKNSLINMSLPKYVTASKSMVFAKNAEIVRM